MSIAIEGKGLVPKPGLAEAQTSSAATYASIAMSTLTAAAVGGIPGAALGLTAAVFDKFLIEKSIFDKRYLSNAFFWKANVISPLSNLLGHFFPQYTLPIYFTAHAVLGLALPYFIDDLFEYKDKLQTPIESFNKINALFDEKNLFSSKKLKEVFRNAYQHPRSSITILKNYINELRENEFLKMFASTMGLGIASLVIHQVFLNFLATYDANSFLIGIFSQNQKLISELKAGQLNFEKISPLLFTALKIFGALILKNKLAWSIRAKRDLASKEQERLILERCTRLILENGNGIKILSSEEGQDLIYHMNNDFKVLMGQGSNKLIDVVTDSTGVVLSLNSVARILDNALVPFILTIPFLQRNVRLAGKKMKDLSAQLVTIQTRLGKVKADLAKNLHQIELSGGAKYLEAQYNSLLNEENSFNKRLDALTKAAQNNDKTFEFYNDFLGYGFYGAQLIANLLDLSACLIIKKSVQTIYRFTISCADLQIKSKELQLASEQTDKLFEIIKRPLNESLKRRVNSQGKIILKNYQLSIGDHPITRIDHLVFEPGVRYALTGKSGCGKSSLLKDIKQGLMGGMKSSGEISVPDAQEQSTLFLGQDLYFPQESTLLETICYPKIASQMTLSERKIYQTRVLELFKELEIDESVNEKKPLGLSALLDSKDFKLSGGQSKKIAIIGAILANPAILILDETFTGLDVASLQLVLKVLLKYLPNTMVLSVDHHADNNNYDFFYQKRVHFENQTATLSDF